MLLSKVAKITGAKDTHEKERERERHEERDSERDKRVEWGREREGDRVR